MNTIGSRITARSYQVTFRWDVSLGESLTFGLTLIITLASLTWFIYQEWKKRQPFDMRFSEETFRTWPAEGFRIPRRKTWQAPIGESTVLIAITAQVEAFTVPFDIRFVERDWLRWGRWKNLAIEVAELTSLSAEELERNAVYERDYIGPNEVTKTHNGVGGFYVKRRKATAWAVGEILWVELTIRAHQRWSGYLSFEGRTSRRAFARREFTIQ